MMIPNWDGMGLTSWRELQEDFWIEKINLQHSWSWQCSPRISSSLLVHKTLQGTIKASFHLFAHVCLNYTICRVHIQSTESTLLSIVHVETTKVCLHCDFWIRYIMIYRESWGCILETLGFHLTFHEFIVYTLNFNGE